MEYCFKKRSSLSFEDTLKKARDVLLQNDFSIMMELNIKEAMEKKLYVQCEPYMIIGACHAPFAHRLLRAEKELGVMLPCNLAVFEENGEVNVAMVHPRTLMSLSDNEEIQAVAGEAEERIQKIFDEI